MAKICILALFILGVVLALTTVESKTFFNENGEMIEETADDQELQNMDELTEVNEDSDDEKRWYRPRRIGCGNGLYDPRFQVCCCGKIHKRRFTKIRWRRYQWTCCGYQLIDGYYNKCCPYFTVISKKHKCPRSKI